MISDAVVGRMLLVSNYDWTVLHLKFIDSTALYNCTARAFARAASRVMLHYINAMTMMEKPMTVVKR